MSDSLVNTLRNAANSRILLQAAKVLVAGLLCYFTAAFFYITFSRINYPFVLEWLEGASLIQVNRINSGQLLYVKPSLDYVALVYTPLYFYVSALLSKIIGFGFLPLRLVSLFSSLGCVALIYLWVQKHTGSVYASLMSAGSFLAIYKIGGAWYDIARVDMLALFLILSAIYLAEKGTVLHQVLAGAALSLACLTKQTYLIMVLPLFIYAFSIHRARSFILVAAALFVSAGVYLWLNWLYQGWYSFFVYTLAFRQGNNLTVVGISQFVQVYWKGPVIKSVPIIFLLFALYFVRKTQEFGKLLGMLALASGMILFSWSGMINKGGYNNVLIPSYAIFLMFAWLFIGGLLENVAVSNIVRTAVLLIYSAQLLWLLYPIARQIPTADDLKAGQTLLQQIRNEPGDVYIPYDNYLALYAGKKTFANYAATGDLVQGTTPEVARAWTVVNSQLNASLRGTKFSLIVLDQKTALIALDRFYQPVLLPYNPDAFMPVTGWPLKPMFIYAPRNAQ